MQDMKSRRLVGVSLLIFGGILAVAENPGVIIDRPVDLMDPAIPEYRPVRPNRYLAGATLGCGLFLMIVAIVCLAGREAALNG